MHGEGVGGHVIRVVLLTEPLREHSCRTRTRPGTGIVLAESGNLVVLNFIPETPDGGTTTSFTKSSANQGLSLPPESVTLLFER